jgi:competence protein ComEA
MPSLALSLAHRRRLAVGLVLVVLAVVAWRHVGGGSSSVGSSGDAAGVRAPIVPRTTQARAPTKQLVVDVVGAVHTPGLYHLASGARIADAVLAAGGLTTRADPLLVNLAALVADGEQVIVAARGAGAGGPSGGATPAGPATPVDLNSATAEQLDTLPGVGPVTAQKIVQYRQEHGPFTSSDGLDAIPGIGPARIGELKGLVVP